MKGDNSYSELISHKRVFSQTINLTYMSLIHTLIMSNTLLERNKTGSNQKKMETSLSKTKLMQNNITYWNTLRKIQTKRRLQRPCLKMSMGVKYSNTQDRACE